MAKFQHIWEGNKPRLGENITLKLQGKSLVLCKDDGVSSWIQLNIEDYDKRVLLKALLRDFLGV